MSTKFNRSSGQQFHFEPILKRINETFDRTQTIKKRLNLKTKEHLRD